MRRTTAIDWAAGAGTWLMTMQQIMATYCIVNCIRTYVKRTTWPYSLSTPTTSVNIQYNYICICNPRCAGIWAWSQSSKKVWMSQIPWIRQYGTPTFPTSYRLCGAAAYTHPWRILGKSTYGSTAHCPLAVGAVSLQTTTHALHRRK